MGRPMAGRILLLVLLPAALAVAQDDGARMDALEKENAELRQRVEKLEGAQHAVAADVEETAEGLGLNMVVKRGNVWGIFQLFGDTGVTYSSPELPNRGEAFFFDGGIDLFFTARVGDHFQVLSETVFLTSIGATSDTSKFDQERLWGAWKFSDLLQLKLGLEHGPISRWNNLYHHGKWLELTITRPFLARFEGDGGILPMHEAGVEARGAVPLAKGRLTYVFFLSNGRGPLVTDVEEFSDHNDAKAITAGLGFEPMGTHPLWVAVFVRWDEIPPNPADPARVRSIGQIVTTLQLDYRGERIQVLSEVAFIADGDRTSSTDFDHVAAYFQVGYSLDDEWTPYFRFDIREMDQGDPYYSPVNRDLDAYEIVAGVRFDFVENAAIKFEVGFGEREERDGVGVVSDRGYIRVGFQLSFVF